MGPEFLTVVNVDSKPVCRTCIYEKLSGGEANCCPVCNINLGSFPLEKLRQDRILQDLQAKLFPFKRRKINAPVAPKASRVTELEIELANVQSEVACLKTEKEAMSDQLNALLMQLGQKDKEISVLQANKQALESQLTELERHKEKFVTDQTNIVSPDNKEQESGEEQENVDEQEEAEYDMSFLQQRKKFVTDRTNIVYSDNEEQENDYEQEEEVEAQSVADPDEPNIFVGPELNERTSSKVELDAKEPEKPSQAQVELCVAIKLAITDAAAHIATMARDTLNCSPVFTYNLMLLQVLSLNLFPDCSESKKAFESIPKVLNSAMLSLHLICTGIPLLDADGVQKNILFCSIDIVIGGLQGFFSAFRIMSLLQEDQLLSKALKQLEEKDVSVDSLRQKEEEMRKMAEEAKADWDVTVMELREKTVDIERAMQWKEENDILVAGLCQEGEMRSVAEQAQVKQAQAESALKVMQLKEERMRSVAEQAQAKLAQAESALKVMQLKEEQMRSVAEKAQVKLAQAESALKVMQLKEEEMQSVAEQAQAESGLRVMQLKEKTIAGTVEETKKEIRESLTKQFQDILSRLG
ncbi:uncharacterized protein LOC133790731 isoform X2 [Humulus lupulus]|uniref:uncharacterized protein LOC133790731 isoform X2 n=1 Tax=Humulus lupulus TaxID=3486 RepID=UPI002B415C7A|nr:uncharacterized protein LOC133790731 isoform X2 [Humulus lupulus]